MRARSGLSLLRTSTFRFAVIYVVIFALSVGAVLAYVYWSTASLLEDQTDNAIGSEVKAIAEVCRQNVKLPTGGKPRWRLLEAGLHLGYRLTKDGEGSGTWIARRYVGQGSYQERALGSQRKAERLAACRFVRGSPTCSTGSTEPPARVKIPMPSFSRREYLKCS